MSYQKSKTTTPLVDTPLLEDTTLPSKVTLNGYNYTLKIGQSTPKDTKSSPVLNSSGKPNSVIKVKGFEYNLDAGQFGKSEGRSSSRSRSRSSSRARQPVSEETVPEYVLVGSHWYMKCPKGFTPPTETRGRKA